VSGTIRAKGGDYGAFNDSGSPPNGRDNWAVSGCGSGGAIRLVADRVLGTGQLIGSALPHPPKAKSASKATSETY
jgi:hypothetical protein